MSRIADLLGQIFKSEVPAIAPREMRLREEFRSTLFESLDQYMAQIDPTRKVRYDEVDEMDTRNPLIAKTLDIIAEEACPTDPRTGFSFRVVSKDAQVSAIGNDLLDRLKFDDHARDYAREAPKYGECMRKITYITQGEAQQEGIGTYGVMSLEEIRDPVMVDPVLELGRLQAWNIHNVALPPWEFWHIAMPGRSTMREKAPHSFHGRSWLEPARPIWRALKVSENALLLARVTGSVAQRVFPVPAENVDPKDIPALIQDYRRMLSRKYQISSEGDFYRRVNPFAYDENIYWPAQQGVNTRVETIGGNVDIRAIEDIKYWQNIMFASLGVPREFLQYERSGGGLVGKDLSYEDIRFARSVRKIQKAVVDGLFTLVRIELALRGIDPFEVEFDIQTGVISFLEEKQRAEALKLATEVGQSMGVLGQQLGIENAPDWKDYVLSSIGAYVGSAMAMDELQELLESSKAPGPEDLDMDPAAGQTAGSKPQPFPSANKATGNTARRFQLMGRWRHDQVFAESQLYPTEIAELSCLEYLNGRGEDLSDDYEVIWEEEEKPDESPQLVMEGMNG